MPLLDHFHTPHARRRSRESFLVTWAGAVADALNGGLLPEGFSAEEFAHAGPRGEIDTASADAGAPTPRAWIPPAPGLSMPAAFPDAFEVLVFESRGGPNPVAAVAFVSPADKDLQSHRHGFAVKCAGYLAQGVGLVVVDVVTNREANLHNEILRALGHAEPFLLPEDVWLYAVTYRPVVREGAEQVDVWPEPLAVGRPLPVVPLALGAGLCLPLDLEATHATACQRRRLA